MEEKRENKCLDSKPAIMHIDSLIHVIRGKHVMLDSDLARLYGVETRRLNEQVRRNIERFPEDFMFRLNKDEIKNLKSQIATSSWGGTRKQPYVFTENGVAMLSSVLHSKTAIEVNIQIMRVFTAMRSFMQTNSHMLQRLETIEHHQLLLHQHQNETDRKIEEGFFIIDDSIYFIGGSIKDLGKKIVAFCRLSTIFHLFSNFILFDDKFIKNSYICTNFISYVSLLQTLLY